MSGWKLIIILLLTARQWHVHSQEHTESPYIFHDLTIYVIPSLSELNWESPSILYQGYKKGAVAKIFQRESYILGHLFIEFTTPLRPGPVYAGMASKSAKEKRRLVFKQHIGLGILGVGVQGYLESPEQLIRKIRINSERGTIAAITYRLNEDAALRILEFLDEFNMADDRGHKPANHYGGAFWPLYRGEGAGCTAYVMGMLDLAGIMNEETEYWKVAVDIPMSLVGGDINPGNKVTIMDLKNAKKWYDQNGTPNADYIPFWIYDPSYVYKWISEQLSRQDTTLALSYYNASTPYFPRLFSDARHVEVDKDKPVFIERKEENIFIRHFRLKNRLNDNNAGVKGNIPQP
jgi:hypothetical protein